MALTVLIDGYNLIAELWGMGRGTPALERQRAELLALLAGARSRDGAGMEVVFDGWREGTPLGSRSREAGIDVVFSPKGVTADEVIRDRVREGGGGAFLVVSSDRRVQGWARAAGAAVTDAATFAARLGRRAAPPEPEEPEGEWTDDAGDDDAWSGHTVKKGNPNRRSKRQRALDRRFGKL
jgi:predicted RNA-binding protein with PIN domain